jgi:hypothetical protein
MNGQLTDTSCAYSAHPTQRRALSDEREHVRATIRIIGADVMHKSSLRTVQPNSLRMGRRKSAAVKRGRGAAHSRSTTSLQLQLGIITLSLQAGVLPARTRCVHDRKCDDGMIFDAEGNKHNFGSLGLKGPQLHHTASEHHTHAS